MLKIMSMHKRDSRGMVKSNFVTLCLALRSSIPTVNLKDWDEVTNDLKSTLLSVYFAGIFRLLQSWPLISRVHAKLS